MINSNFAELPDSNLPLMVKYRECTKNWSPGEMGCLLLRGIMFAEPFVEGVKGRQKPDHREPAQSHETLKDWKGLVPDHLYANERQGGTRILRESSP